MSDFVLSVPLIPQNVHATAETLLTDHICILVISILTSGHQISYMLSAPVPKPHVSSQARAPLQMRAPPRACTPPRAHAPPQTLIPSSPSSRARKLVPIDSHFRDHLLNDLVKRHVWSAERLYSFCCDISVHPYLYDLEDLHVASRTVRRARRLHACAVPHR